MTVNMNEDYCRPFLKAKIGMEVREESFECAMWRSK